MLSQAVRLGTCGEAQVKTKKRNPTDATLRNVNALKARVAKLETELRAARPLLAKAAKLFTITR